MPGRGRVATDTSPDSSPESRRWKFASRKLSLADATSLADGLTRVDGRTLNVVDLRHTPTGTTVRAFEYGAGDNSYGAIFKAGTTTRLASIVDLTYYDCAFAR